mgnify:FL=1
MIAFSTFLQSPLGVALVLAVLTAVGFLIRHLFFRIKDDSSQSQTALGGSSQQAGRDIINVAPQKTTQKIHPQSHPHSESQGAAPNIGLLKRIVTILFIDDDYSNFPVVKVLRTSGWINAGAIGDVTVDDERVSKADIIFVDIHGVGSLMGFAREGLGLASAIKKRYPGKKVITYSAQASGSIFDPAIRAVDAILPKDAEPYEFIRLVEQFAPEVGSDVLRNSRPGGQDTDF